MDASHTTRVFLDAPAGVSFVADSGHNYSSSPHPPPFASSTVAHSGMTIVPGTTLAFCI
jgi:hypothetical protein